MTDESQIAITSNNIDGFVNFVLNQIGKDAIFSQELLKSGTKTQLAQTIQTFLEDPFNFKIEALKSTHTALVSLVDKYVMAYLNAKGELLSKVYRFDTATGINYFLILNEDNTENREVFFQLLDHYESLKINAILPLNLSFLPKKVISKMTLEEVYISK